MATLDDGPFGGDSIECPNCEIDLCVESFWDGEDTCPKCGADIEWDIDGDTESGFFFSQIRAVEEES